MERVSDDNSVDGNDNCTDVNSVSSGVEHLDIGLACDSCVVSVVLYKRDGRGSDMSDPSEIERIPSLRSQSRVEWWRLML